MLYPQNGDRIVTVDSVTSLQPMYTYVRGTDRAPAALVRSANQVATLTRVTNELSVTTP